MAIKKSPLTVFCLVGFLVSCKPSYRTGIITGLNDLVSDGMGYSYCVTSVTWSDSAITFVTDLSFHGFKIPDDWLVVIDYGKTSDLDSIICPFNKIETNLLNDYQIPEDNSLIVEGTFRFVFDQKSDDPTPFIESEDAHIYINLFVNQAGFGSTWTYIANEDVTFLTE